MRGEAYRISSCEKDIMIIPSNIQITLQRHQQLIDTALHEAIERVAQHQSTTPLDAFYGQMRYHLGWVDAQFRATQNNPGKLLRPTLLLLAYEAAGAWGQAGEGTEPANYMRRALPVAAALELTHNFTLIHDDIEDNDAERRHRPTLWKHWGIPQAINTGDGMFALSRYILWDILEEGVDGLLAARLGALLDHTTLIIAEGQYLDISFEQRQDISVAMYLDMISRKTGALMQCAAEMGAMLGTQNAETIQRLKRFGKAIGAAFQIRDDILGVWATSAELGKVAAGDIYRRKKSLPILHAMEQARPHEQHQLHSIYQQAEPLTAEQVKLVLAIFEHTRTKQYCYEFLRRECLVAHEALAHVPRHSNPIAARALDDLDILVNFIEEATRE